jgi:cardiolipin synthase
MLAEIVITEEVGWTLLAVLGAVIHVGGLILGVHAIMAVRTAQGAVAWTIALVTLPYVAVPLYLVFGRRRFEGYVDARRAGELEMHHITRELAAHEAEHRSIIDAERQGLYALEHLARMPFTRGNRVGLLVDGEASFARMFEVIDAATEYVLVQFFIIRDDALGGELRDRLAARAEAGVRVHVMYDEVGSHALSRSWIASLRRAGAEVEPFNTTRGITNRFQLNFRNHRKIVLVDGRVAFTGGLNVGEEYVTGGPKFDSWRDTQIEVEGPAVQCIQLAFMEDWYWSTRRLPRLQWVPERAEGGESSVLVLPSGPADAFETAGLGFVLAIHGARERIWIASPYFVPGREVIAALQLAALRGVDVRLLLPDKPDHLLVWLSSFSYYRELDGLGIEIHRFQPGFMHQKVMLVDQRVGVVGTANLDNRSFRLNFELSVVVDEPGFAADLERMFEADFARSRQVNAAELDARPFWFRLAVRASRLLAPIQ